MSQPLYVFDMDETLLDGDSSMLWNQYLVDKGVVTIPNFIETDRRLMGLYAIGKMDMEEYLEFVMQPLFPLPVEDVERMVDDFVETYIKPRLFLEALELIETLKRQQASMLIISATVSFIVHKVASALGIDHAIGIDMVVKEGCYTAQIEGVPSYREGKIRRLKHWVSAQGAQFSPIHFYTDSINDLPLCEYSDHAYLVNPCPQLRAVSQGRNWDIYHWDKTRLA